MFETGADFATASRTVPDTSQLTQRASRPKPGRSLGGIVTRTEVPIRAAIRELLTSARNAPDPSALLFDCTVYGPEPVTEPPAIRTAWFIVTIGIVHAIAQGLRNTAPFRTSLDWFFDGTTLAHKVLALFAPEQLQAAQIHLGDLAVNDDLIDLFPYVLEPHGHVTRSRLEKCSTARSLREEKRAAGVYYTPSDVADFMVAAISQEGKSTGSWLDPACGTGVFLRAVLRHVLDAQPADTVTTPLETVLSGLFGIDRSALATDLASFTVLVECLLKAPLECSPWEAWRQIKTKIVCMNALRLEPTDSMVALHIDAPVRIKTHEIFPRANPGGFDHVVMNPPYCSVQVDDSLRSSWHSFSGLKPAQKGDAHIAFAEMTWRMTSKSGSAAAVLPLSIATNSTRMFRDFREELLCSSGSKEFLFFDREPQSLFGEDVKTRNVILIRNGSETAVEAKLRTSRLLKWSGPQRSSIFTRERSVPVSFKPQSAFIPKLGSTPEAQLYSALTQAVIQGKSSSLSPQATRAHLDDAVNFSKDESLRTLLVSGTAYNFLNVFFAGSLPAAPAKPYSRSPVNALRFHNEEFAFAAYAVMASRLAFWLWNVEGDGFHVTGAFIRRLPLWAVFASKERIKTLSSFGETLWNVAQMHPVGSINGGRQTYSYHFGHNHAYNLAVEAELLSAFKLPLEFSACLDSFVEAVVSRDQTRITRTQFTYHQQAI